MNRIKLTDLPSKPGVYLFIDGKDEILYVGKAKTLKSRVSSYFNKSNLSRPWTSVMIPLIKRVETIVTSNEVEALMLEATLIKKHMPRFNILLTDDKSYPYIKLTINEDFPRLQVVRKISRDDARYFGPYLSARSAVITCKFLRRLYGVHLSRSPIQTNKDRRPCLNCQLEGNPCPYAREIDKNDYRLAVDEAIEFLQGKRKKLIKQVEHRMKLAAADNRFELAASLRDRLASLKHITDRQRVISATGDNYDAIGISRTSETAELTVFRVREGRINEQYSFGYTLPSEEMTDELVRQFLVSIYINFENLPPLVVTCTAIKERTVIEKLLKLSRGGKLVIRQSKRGDKLAVVKLATKNAEIRLETKLASQDKSFGDLIALKELLKLRSLPRRIESVDISNFGASESVGAVTCFIDGQSDKNEYRRYKIKTVAGQNDFAMIAEVVKRRLTDTKRPLPDILMIDGGKAQLNSALSVVGSIRNSQLQIRNLPYIITLAKKPDRIFVPEQSRPILTAKQNRGLRLLARIRDETHRFAISFQRLKQADKSLRS